MPLWASGQAETIHGLKKQFVLAECCCQLAESEKSAVRIELEAKRDQLVQNYMQEQRKLYSELLPEVNMCSTISNKSDVCGRTMPKTASL